MSFGIYLAGFLETWTGIRPHAGSPPMIAIGTVKREKVFEDFQS